MLGNTEAACNLLCTQWGTPHPAMHLVLIWHIKIVITLELLIWSTFLVRSGSVTVSQNQIIYCKLKFSPGLPIYQILWWTQKVFHVIIIWNILNQAVHCLSRSKSQFVTFFDFRAIFLDLSQLTFIKKITWANVMLNNFWTSGGILLLPLLSS